MEHEENYFLCQNKLLEDKLDYCKHLIETRLDKLYQRNEDSESNSQLSKISSPYSSYTFLTFKSPYIRDFRNFSGPLNDDVKQISQLRGTENVDQLIKCKSWSKDSRRQLYDAVLDHYSRVHILDLIKQKNALQGSLDQDEVACKMTLIDEQIEQVKARKEPRIFVPEDKTGSQVDWCAISAKLSTHHDSHDCRLMWSNKLHWSINDGLWTKEEDVCLLNAIAKYGKNNWDSVARELNSNRLAWQCCSRYNQEFAYPSTPLEDDAKEKVIEVINLCRIGSYVPWNQVMYFIKSHSLSQVKYQWQKLLSENKSNLPWSHNEDLLLLRAIEQYGDKDWLRIASCIPGRSNKSCRERYIMRLRFEKRAVGSWRRKEDSTLLSLIERFGTNWSLISSHFPERNNHQLRNRYELLKQQEQSNRTGPIRHRKIYRNSSGELVNLVNRRQKQESEVEVDRKLYEIFSTYQSVSSLSKSLVYRSGQDEVIYQNLVQVLCDFFLGQERERGTLGNIIEKAVSAKPGLMTPCMSTLRGYKAWALQQDYLRRLTKDVDCDTIEIDGQILKTVVSLFLWPAVLSRMKRPEVNVNEYQVKSIIEKDSKNLYKIRDIQRQITR